MKRPKNQQSLRLSKKLIVAGLFLSIPILMMIIGMFSPSFATFWWQVFAGPMEGTLYLLFQFIPISFYLILVILAVFCVILKITRVFNVDKTITALLVIMVCAILPLIFYASGANVQKIDRLYFPKNVAQEYTADDLYDLTLEFSNKARSLALEKQNPDTNDGIVEKATENLKHLSTIFKFLDGTFVKNIKFENLEYGGITFPYSVRANSKYSDEQTLQVVQHELCHTKGLIREAEAEFCGVLASLEGNDDFSKLNGYAEAIAISSAALETMGYDIGKVDEIKTWCNGTGYNCGQFYDTFSVDNDYEADGLLSPFQDSSDFWLLFDSAEFYKEYGYLRSARLLLEYFK